MTHYRPILILVFCAAAAPLLFARSDGYPITPQQVAATVTGGGLQVSADEVSLLADVVATVPQPTLKLKSVSPAADHQVIARLECADARQCLPFMVVLNVDRGALASAAEASDGQPSRPQVPLVRAGSHAVLQLDGAHVHISIPVICLENGALGENIRVASLDRNQFYTVQVAENGVLRGTL